MASAAMRAALEARGGLFLYPGDVAGGLWVPIRKLGRVGRNGTPRLWAPPSSVRHLTLDTQWTTLHAPLRDAMCPRLAPAQCVAKSLWRTLSASEARLSLSNTLCGDRSIAVQALVNKG